MYILNLKGGSQKSLTHDQIGLLLKVLILIFRRTPPTHTFECKFKTAAIYEVFCCLDKKKDLKNCSLIPYRKFTWFFLKLIFKKILTQQTSILIWQVLIIVNCFSMPRRLSIFDAQIWYASSSLGCLFALVLPCGLDSIEKGQIVQCHVRQALQCDLYV